MNAEKMREYLKDIKYQLDCMSNLVGEQVQKMSEGVAYTPSAVAQSLNCVQIARRALKNAYNETAVKNEIST